MKTTNAGPWRLTKSASLIFTLARLCWVLPASAATTIYVPTGTNITTVQGGIDAAVNGDTILVSDGIYPGGIATEPASTYQLQCSTNLSSWDTLVANIPGTGDYYRVLDPLPVAGQGMRFYRALQFYGPSPETCRSANRSAAFPDGRSSGVGFRVLLAK